MRALARWAVAAGLTLAGFGALLWLFRYATFSWLPHAEADRWLVDTGFATAGAATVGAGAAWWAGREEPEKAEPQVHLVNALDQADPTAPVNTLPPRPATLLGREARLEELMALLRPGKPSTAVVPTLVGMAGVGKTALALHAAHDAVEAGWFHSALFLDLQGYDPKLQFSGEQAVQSLARTLNTHGGNLPATPNEQLETLRLQLSLRAEHKHPTLIVADNASSAEQVAPLIPSSTQHRILITSRHTLAALPPARLINLDEIDSAFAGKLISAALRRARPDHPRPKAEAEAIEKLAEQCAGLPLALEIIAQVLAASPGLHVIALVEELADEHTRLAARSGDADGGKLGAVRAAFDLSYRHLPPPAKRLFRLLGCNPGPEISAAAAAALVDKPLRSATALLHLLDQAHLVKFQTRSERWRMHDLIRLYAADLAGDDPEQATATTRLVTHYQDAAHAANIRLRSLPPPDGVRDQEDALAWFDAERTNLLNTVSLARTADHAPIAVSLALNLAYYFAWRGRADDERSVARLALDAASLIGDEHSRGAALNNLGLALMEARQYEQAIALLVQATEIFQERGHRHAVATTRNNLGEARREWQIYRYDVAAGLHTAETASRFPKLTLLRHHVASPQLRAGSEEARESWLREASNYDHAIDDHLTAVEIFRAVGDRRNEAAVLLGLSLDLLRAHRYAEGRRNGLEAMRIFTELSDHYGAIAAADDLVPELERAGEFDACLAVLRRALHHYLERRDHAGYATAVDRRRSIERAARRARDSTMRRRPGRMRSE